LVTTEFDVDFLQFISPIGGCQATAPSDEALISVPTPYFSPQGEPLDLHMTVPDAVATPNTSAANSVIRAREGIRRKNFI
jgi:hypothetical protein